MMYTAPMGRINNSKKNNLSPSEYSEKLGFEYSLSQSPEFKKRHGQYMTPTIVANFMARLVNPKKESITVLDPGAGTGILSCSLLEHFANLGYLKNIKLIAYEIDEQIIPYLKKSLVYSRKWLQKKRINLIYKIENQDFILKNSDSFNLGDTLFPLENSVERFDYIISNPPYFKLSKSDHRSKVASQIVYGQPNIYAIFMMMSALLLNENGELIFITPRSYAAGSYFKVFRERFFTIVQPNCIHLFGSRKDAFDREAILQENIILKAIKDHAFNKPDAKVLVSFSQGIKDLDSAIKRTIPIKEIIDLKTKNKVLRIPLTYEDDKVIGIVHSWKENLHSLGLNISTGPVVAFRASNFISNNGKSNGHKYSPLLWLHNVKTMKIEWPTTCRKPQFIEQRDKTKKLLIKNKNYVFLRRFSSKEEDRRLIAAPYLSGTIQSDRIGLENHLNYIYRPAGDLSIEEVFGLAALLNSGLLDLYFRTSNGNTQVSATELKDMPMPSIEFIKDLGKHILKNNFENEQIDKLLQENLASSL